jgi:hypothetical protein
MSDTETQPVENTSTIVQNNSTSLSNVKTNNVKTNNVKTNNTKTNNTKTNNTKTNNTKTNTTKMNNASSSQEVEALQTQLQQNTGSLQQAIQGGDCKVINEEVKKVVKSGNSVMSMINAGKAKEEDFSDLKSQLQTATANIKSKCPPTTSTNTNASNQTGGKRRKTRKQKRKARKSRRM